MSAKQSKRRVRIFCGSDISDADRMQIQTISKQVTPDLEIIFNKSGACDLAVVLNFDPKIHWVRCPAGRFVKWLTEPVVGNTLSRRFSLIHAQKYDHVHTSDARSKRDITSPPLYPPRVSNELLEAAYSSESELPEKTRFASIVLSNLTDLPGHKFRHSLVRALRENGNKNIEIFGRGVNPVDKKEEALLPFMFSLVIENTFSGHYWSEKVTDAFLCGTVPIYVGAANLKEYFPKNSFIDANGLTADQLAVALERLDPSEYFNRITSLHQAKDLFLYKWNLPRALEELVSRAPSKPNPRFHSTLDSNTIVHWFLTVVSPFLRLGAATLHKHLKSKI